MDKEIDGKAVEFEEFFITDLVEYLDQDGLAVGYVIAQDEEEVMGIDDAAALKKAQERFCKKTP